VATLTQDQLLGLKILKGYDYYVVLVQTNRESHISKTMNEDMQTLHKQIMFSAAVYQSSKEASFAKKFYMTHFSKGSKNYLSAK
jgi:hypothetical protein